MWKKLIKVLGVILLIVVITIIVLYIVGLPLQKYIIGVAHAPYNTPRLPMSLFAEGELLQTHWKDIQSEALHVASDAVNANEISKSGFTRLNRSKKWKLFMLKFYGKEYPDNAKKCPITMSLLNKIPRIKCAFFSILEPGM